MFEHVFNQPSVTMSSVKSWAADACNAYMQDSVPPTDTLCKIAKEHSLTPHQIQVVAGEINKVIHIEKCAASSGDKYHAADFPLADSRKALELLQIPAESKTAFEMPAPKINNDFDYMKAFGVEPEAEMKTAAEFRAGVAKQQKMASLKRLQDDTVFMAKEASSNAEFGFIKQARQMVIDGLDSADRLSKLGMVIHAVKCAGMFDIARKPLAKLAYSLKAEGLIGQEQADRAMEYVLEKKADETAPQELINEYLQAKVVNGNHPLLISLKTFHDAEDRVRNESTRAGVIDNSNMILGQKIRAL